MNKRIAYLILISIFGVLFFVAPSEAQTNPTEKVIQGVKDTVDALIEAKDKNSPEEAKARLDAYKKVLDLALQDSKETRLKLLAFENEKTTTTAAIWKADRLKNMSSAVKHYEDELSIIGKMENPSMEEVKARAEELKTWREEFYIPLSEEVQAFLLIETQKKSLETAKNRLEKVNADVVKLRKAKFRKISEVETRFKTAAELIADAERLNSSAEREFAKWYLLPFMKDGEEKKILEKELKEDKEKIEKEKKAAESKDEDSSDSAPVLKSTSIKGMVDGSFSKVKDSYRIFIEMSDLVRKLL